MDHGKLEKYCIIVGKLSREKTFADRYRLVESDHSAKS